MNHTIYNNDLNIGSENMKKEMIFPPNRIGVINHIVTKGIVAPFIRHIIKIDKYDKCDPGRMNKRVKIIKTNTIKKTTKKAILA